jgi:GntR family transcriptional regulator, transcriptional repressor for pyruvate dehydrogenase complex
MREKVVQRRTVVESGGMPPKVAKPIKPNGLADQVIQRMRAMIANGTYAVGDRLPPEAELCTLFGVGRSTIREAMRVLGNRGLVHVRQGEGTFVASTTLRESLEERLGRAALEDIYEARLVIELPIAELAAQRRDARDIAAMRKCLSRRERAIRAGDVAAYAASDFAFHLAVAKAAKNSALFSIYESFVQVVEPLLVAATTPDYLRTENDRLHAELCDAIAGGDARETRRLVVSHLKHSLKKTAKSLPSRIG